MPARTTAITIGVSVDRSPESRLARGVAGDLTVAPGGARVRVHGLAELPDRVLLREQRNIGERHRDQGGRASRATSRPTAPRPPVTSSARRPRSCMARRAAGGPQVGSGDDELGVGGRPRKARSIGLVGDPDRSAGGQITVPGLAGPQAQRGNGQGAQPGPGSQRRGRPARVMPVQRRCLAGRRRGGGGRVAATGGHGGWVTHSDSTPAGRHPPDRGDRAPGSLRAPSGQHAQSGNSRPASPT